VILVVLLIGGGGVMAGLQTQVVQAADAERITAVDALAGDLHAVGGVVMKLASKGADGGRMREAMQAFEAAPAGVVREAEAVAIFELIASQHAAVVTRYGEQAELKAPMDNLAAKAQAVRKARRDALEARASVGGQLAAALGWIEPGA
jgi:hypothetical protein